MTLSRRIALTLYERRWWVPRWLQRLAGVSIRYYEQPIMLVYPNRTEELMCKGASICPTNGVGLPSFRKAKQ